MYKYPKNFRSGKSRQVEILVPLEEEAVGGGCQRIQDER